MSVPSSGSLPAPPPPPHSGTPSSLQSPASPDRESSLRSRDVREAGVPTPPRPPHSPSATCAAAPAPAQLLLQREHLLAADLPAPSQLRAPDSGRPPGPAWWSGAGRLRPRPRPREGSGLPSTPSTADPVPSPAVARRWPEAAPLASDFTAFWIWFSTWGRDELHVTEN